MSSSAVGGEGAKETLFGYEIPMPRSDLFIAFATVLSFLPVFVIAYRTVSWAYKSLRPKQE